MMKQQTNVQVNVDIVVWLWNVRL